jgi:hypothetical protein
VAFVTVSDGRAPTVVPLSGDVATGAPRAGWTAGGVAVVVGPGVGAVGLGLGELLEQAGTATVTSPSNRIDAETGRTIIMGYLSAGIRGESSCGDQR